MDLFDETHLFVITKPFIITQSRTFLAMIALATAFPDVHRLGERE
jgi:hypothetical protein